MKKKEWCIRICFPFENDLLDNNPDIGTFLECLRYAGVGTIHETDTTLVFDIHCPKGLESKPWAEINAKRMKTFGFLTAAAPRT